MFFIFNKIQYLTYLLLNDGYNMKKTIISLVLTTILVSACAIDPYTGQKKVSNTAKGTLFGAVSGAAIGAIANGKDGALAGAAIGGVAGAGVGGYMDVQAKALRQELQGTGVSVEKNGEEIKLIMPGNITFASSSYTLNSSFKPVLDSVAKVFKKYNKTHIGIVGYTDNTGSASVNNTLSFNRANAVANYLKLKGVSADRMLIEGKGSKNPIATNSTASGREQNRRVEISLVQE